MSPLRSGPAGRSKQVAVIVGVVAAVGVGGWFTGLQMQSPADAAAAHQPPKAGPVTVAVARQKLTATVVAQGAVEFGAPQSVSLSGPVGAPGEEETAQRVTKLPTEGETLREGSVLMQVSGRPVFVLRGSVPMYRSLGPGGSGDDVRQLQSALRRIGHDPGAVSGNYREGTAAAVGRWYESKGYEPQSPGAADQQQRADLEAAVSRAQLELVQLQSGGGGSASAGDDKDGGTAAAPGSAETEALQLRSARQQLDQANAALNAFRATYGTKVPAGEVVFLPDLPVRVDKVKVKLGDSLDGEVATVTSSDVVVQATVPGADGATLREGMEARIEALDGREVRGVVSRVGGAGAGPADDPAGDASGDGGKAGTDEEPAGDSAADDGSAPADPSAPVAFEISVPDPGPLRNQSGGTAKVTIEVGASKGTVLVVPVAALRTSTDGNARVHVRRDGRTVTVPVTVGLAAAGLVEVTPDSGSLDEGDQVVVGQ
ncbi:Tat pathway signal protein [Streptomyces sp. AS58]|uniref:peptidoglycan-binding protein n=1 Tax=Streptomyces sp. AS58 TaxID=1519489 RepID=UPI0006AE1647|nr:peptidoglycan-binding protein [Streptomyces sp. AS58]KOV73662.1 Tat pathway signal protein [Streptomyces sp. AS58]